MSLELQFTTLFHYFLLLAFKSLLEENPDVFQDFLIIRPSQANEDHKNFTHVGNLYFLFSQPFFSLQSDVLKKPYKVIVIFLENMFLLL